MWIFVGEDGPADRTGKNHEDDYYENDRCVQEVNIKV